MGNEKATMDDLVKVCEMANAHEFIRRLPDVNKNDDKFKLLFLGL